MYGALAETGAGLIVQYGLLLLLAVFILEGALVGKLIPTRALFVAAVLAVGSDGVVAVVAAAVVGATLGQVVLFGVVRYTTVGSEAIPGADGLEGSRLGEWFDRWGLSAVVRLEHAAGRPRVADRPGGAVRDDADPVLGVLAGRDRRLCVRAPRRRDRPRSPHGLPLSRLVAYQVRHLCTARARPL